MGFSRTAARIACYGVLFAAGVLSSLALLAHLPATACVIALIALAVAAWLAYEQRPSPPRLAAPALPHEVVLEVERRLRLLETLVDQAPVPLLTAEPQSAPKPMNRAARRLLKTTSSDGQVMAELEAAVQEASPNDRRTIKVVSAGRERTFALLVADAVAAAHPIRLVALTDVQPEIQAAEAAALKQLLQVLSHEIMNTLTPITSLAQSASELLQDPGVEAVQLARQSIEVIARRCEGLHRFVTAYRQLARLPEPQVRTVSVRAMLQDAGRMFDMRWRAFGIELHTQFPNPDIIVRADPDLIGQALLNLLTNAAEAALAAAHDPGEVWLAAESMADGAVITVEDSGEGIAAARQDEVFQPFFTTKAGGSGVGLSIARQAVVSQGGQLDLSSAEHGRGARFRIIL